MALSLPINVTPVAHSRRLALSPGPLPFGTIFSDHMFVAPCHGGRWQDAEIRPYGPLPFPPATTALHYGASVFEGLKAFQTIGKQAVLFRPQENCRRLNRSAARLVMPAVPEELFLEGLKQLVQLDRDWIPSEEGGALYIRPLLFGADENILVKPSDTYWFLIFTCPVGAYFSEPVDLWVSRDYVRAFEGGTGAVKPAGNYAAAFLATHEAQQKGYHNVLWLDGKQGRFVEECGVMNIFFVIGERVVTPPLTGTILPGVTRDSVITLLRDMGIVVEERLISLEELAAAHDNGTLRECFGTGTAATVAHVGKIGHEDRDLLLPPVEERRVGPAVLQRLQDIRTGRAPDPYGWLVPV
jgi:branched-chain amino acid aminotransferase